MNGPRKMTGRCAICGERIQRMPRGWQHGRPQPSGAPHDHKPRPR